MKKKIALFLAAALISAGLIVSCGGGGDDDEETGNPTNPNTPVAPGTQYTVSFDTDGGEPATIASIKVDAGKAVGAGKWPDNPTKGTDTFVGWFEGATEYKSNTPINKDVALKAKWQGFVWPTPLLTFDSFHPLGEFTGSNPGADTQKGWLFGEGGDDYAFTDNTWLLLELKGGNMNGFPGLQLTFIQNYEGDVGKLEADLKGDWDSYAKGADEIIYYAIKLSQHSGYATFKAADSYTLYLGSYPWSGLGFLNAYLTDDDLDKISENKLFNLKRGEGPNYGFIISTKDDAINWDALWDTTFYAVTSIKYTGPVIGHVGRGINLSGEVSPGNATHKNIVWSGTNVSNGVLTATTAGTSTVTATITNGTSAGDFTASFQIKISTLATSEYTVTLGDLLTANSSDWETDSEGIINKTAFGSQYSEQTLSLADLTSLTATELAKYTKVSIKAKFYKDDKSTEIASSNWGIASIRFINDLNGYTTTPATAENNYNAAFLYNSSYNFGTVSNGVTNGTNIPISGFLQEGDLVVPEAINFQKAGSSGDQGDLKYIVITEIKFLID